MKLIEINIEKIMALCQKYRVDKFWEVGSVLTPRFNDECDVDFSVIFHYEQIPDLFVNFFDFIEDLQCLLGRKIDLIDETAIKNPIFKKELDSTKLLIYG